MLIDFKQDLPLLRDFITSRTRQQSVVGTPICAIEFAFRLSQGCFLFLHFETREKHQRDGEWSSTAYEDEPTLEREHWNKAFEAASDEGIAFVLPSGEPFALSAEAADDEAVAAVFGEALLAVALDALAVGLFRALPMRDDCQLDMEEFDGLWAWPPGYEDVGRTNLLRDLTATRLF